jgi:thiol-disulfide isomerase/thioredoxin
MLQSTNFLNKLVKQAGFVIASFLLLFSLAVPSYAQEAIGQKSNTLDAKSDAKTHQASMNKFDIADYKGEFVYLDFWASWCGPCRASFPWMNTMQNDFASKGLKIVSINLDEEREDADIFLREFPANFDVIFDPQGKNAESYELLGMPSSYFYDANGKLLFTHVGFNHKDAPELREKISKALTSAK